MKNSAALTALAMLAACGELPAEQTAEQTGVAEVEPADVTSVTNRIDDTVMTPEGAVDADTLERRTDAAEQRADAVEARTDALARAHDGTAADAEMEAREAAADRRERLTDVAESRADRLDKD